MSLESGSSLDDSFDNMLAALVSTDIPLKQIADQNSVSLGDLYGLVETSRWLLHSIAVVAELGGLSKVLGMSRGLLEALEGRFSNRGEHDR